MQLRPYQLEAVDAVYRHLRAHDDNPCVVIPTAGGKTPVMATICKDAVGTWNGRVLILAHVKELLEQAADKLDRIAPELHVGIHSAGLNRRDTEHPVIIAGIQSVYKRACDLGAFNLVMVDEAHMIPPDGDGMYRQCLADMKVINPQVRVIGLTATPFRMKSGMICAPENFLTPFATRSASRNSSAMDTSASSSRSRGVRRRIRPVCTCAPGSSSPARRKP